jgi:outer membrane lipoprotein-sorting protein
MQTALLLSNPFVLNVKLTLKAAAKHSSAQDRGRLIFDLKWKMKVQFRIYCFDSSINQSLGHFRNYEQNTYLL